jgi:dTDP-4-amino-4,6-dideoxygalactose transaminase
MIVTQDAALAERLRRLRLHGGSTQYFHDEVGFNSRLDTIQAAVLLAKLPHLAPWSAARARNAARYTEAFTGHPAVCPPKTDQGNTHIYNQYTIRVPRRDELQVRLKARGSARRSTIRSRSTCSPASRTWATVRAACRRRKPRRPRSSHSPSTRRCRASTRTR